MISLNTLYALYTLYTLKPLGSGNSNSLQAYGSYRAWSSSNTKSSLRPLRSSCGHLTYYGLKTSEIENTSTAPVAKPVVCVDSFMG
jgi:hypothetical protein